MTDDHCSFPLDSPSSSTKFFLHYRSTTYRSSDIPPLLSLKLPDQPRGQVLWLRTPGERIPESSDSNEASESVSERVV